MTLARFRMNLLVKHLSYQFKTPVSTVSRTISAVIDTIMYTRMKPLVKWPEKRGTEENNANAVSAPVWITLCSDN